MLKFRIPPNSEVRFDHLNVRTEKHGEADVTAIDLDLRWQTSNRELAMFHPDLLEAFYAPDPGHVRPIPGVERVFPNRVFDSLKPIKWKGEATNMRLVIEHGINAKTDLVIADGIADSFVMEMLDGGSVNIDFRFRATTTDERVLGKLPLLLKHALHMSVEQDTEAVTA